MSPLLLTLALALILVLVIARLLGERPAPPVSTRTCRTILVGTGERAEQVLRENHGTAGSILEVVAVVDLDGARQRRRMCGVRVCGTISDLPALASQLHARLAVIALESGSPAEMRRVVDQCVAAGLQFKTLPRPGELPDIGATVNQLRNVRIDELLGRTPVNLDRSPVPADLHNRVILLTGAAGSVGTELARQIVRFRPLRLILLDRSESDLYLLHLELGDHRHQVDLVPVICDITNQSRLAQVYAQYRPQYVIHAAAYKQVPLMETNVLEAVRNNVLGTLLVATNAVRYGARKVLLVSTDKAIRPSSVMGATKRLAERIIFELPNLHRSGTDFRAVRFGNVLASKGSVLPIFERQLARGGPITVTHPEVQRYFISIAEAAALVLHAGALAEAAGAIAMLDMGEPVRIHDLAEKLVRCSGRVPGKDIQIAFTGLRPGEKLIEEPISELESAVPTSAEQIRIRQPTSGAGPQLAQHLSRLLAFLEAGDEAGLLTTLRELVPECVPPLRQYSSLQDARTDIRSPESWRSVMDPLWTPRLERRRGTFHLAESSDLQPSDRRNGAACRRKTPRMGGRRRTDTGALHAAGASQTYGRAPQQRAAHTL